MAETATLKTPTAGSPCRKCGETVNGKFCSACGTAVDAGADEGWSAVLRQVAKGDGSTLLSTALAVAREPIDAPVRLSLDPAFGGHVKFYLTFVSAAFAAIFVAPQEISRTVFGLDAAGDHSLVKRMMVLQALIILVLTPTFYYLFGWLSAEKRSPLSYFKFSLLAVAASNFLVVAGFAALFVVWTAIVYVLPFDLPSDDRSLGQAVWFLFVLASVAGGVYAVALQSRFWRIRWIWPALAMIVAQLALEVIAPPLLNALGSGAVGALLK